MNIRTDSTEFVFATITTDHNLAGMTIEVALPSTGVAPTSWFPATLESVTQTQTSPAKWTATYKILLGPNGGATTLTPGTYDWTFRLTDSPEKPVRRTGQVIVTLT